MDTRAIGKRIQALIDERGMTRADLARELGYGEMTLDRWMNGQRQITAYALKRVAKYLDVTMDYLAQDI